MNKFRLILILSLAFQTFFGQKSKISIKLDNGNRFNRQFTNFKTGDLYFTYSRQPTALLNLAKDGRFLKFNNQLKEVFNIELAKSLEAPTSKFSGFGNYLINDIFVNEEGEKREYPSNIFFSKIERKSDLNPIFSFFNNYGYTIIGPKIGRKNRKRKYDDGDIFIYNFKNVDFKGETFPMSIPNIATNQKTPQWFLLKQKIEKSFFLTSKDKFKKDYSKDVYHFVEYEFNGKIKSHTTIPISLEEGKYFLPTHNSTGPISHPQSSYGGSFSYATSYVNTSDNTILLYGYYSNKKGKQIRTGKVAGIYAYKFKKGSGELIWKTYLPFKETISSYLIKREIDYSFNGEYGVISCYLKDVNSFFKINNTTGKIESNSSELVDFFAKKKILEDGYFLKLNMYMMGTFIYTFKDKKTNRNKIHMNVVDAMLLKPEIKSFLLNITSKKKKAEYYARVIGNGDIFIIEHLNKDTEINIYKF